MRRILPPNPARPTYAPPVTDAEHDIEAVVAETISFVTVHPEGDGWVGGAPDWFGGVEGRENTSHSTHRRKGLR